MIDRNWLYTAITRAKKDLRMVAPRGRVRKAVRRSQGAGRQTLLTSMEG
jgi:ATP-dependent exoDNAse (exonuclease V) alpha subunit